MRALFILLLTLPFSTTFGQIDHWETVIHASDTWRYFVGTTAPDPNWKALGFNDATWPQGPGGIGYGDGDDATTIGTTLSLYMRKQFTITDLSKIELALLHMDYDDAFVAYLNGTEIARANISVPGEPAYNDVADGWLEAQMFQGNYPPEFTLDQATISNLLNQGNNVLTIQVHNESLGSSDLSAIPFFSVGINDASFTYTQVPSWFIPPVTLTSSNLPIVVVNTNGQTIVDEPDIIAEMGIIDNGPGIRNYTTDPYNDYDGYVTIEIRGQTSQQFFPKKSYGFETSDQFGNDIDTNILGFPKEEDWILNGPYSDKTFIRNTVAMRMGRDMGWYASRTQPCELIINGEYRGVYIMMEKIKRDNDRVDIAKLTVADTTGDDLTGGYIFKIDKGNDGGWLSNYDLYTSPLEKLEFQYVYPKSINILPPQEQYIQAYVDSFENAIASPSYHNSAGKRYTEYIHLNSFVDNFIINEVTKNVDGYRLSTYFHKDKNSNDGKIVAGPIWDFNLGFSNCNYCNADVTSGWMYDVHCDDENPFWWHYMRQDSVFINALSCRWNYLRSTTLDLGYLNTYIDSMATYLDEAQQRNFAKWPILGNYVWPNPSPYPTTYAGEIQNLKSWLQDRITWMDNNIPAACDPTGVATATAAPPIELYPNPSQGMVQLTLPAGTTAQVVVYDVMGKQVYKTATRGPLNLSHLSKGSYQVRIFLEEQVHQLRFMKQ